jgi:hypothetical protein
MTNAEKLKKQILAIRDFGQVNMLDVNGVQQLAYRCGFYDLVLFIEEHKKDYGKFIMTGEDKYLEVAE